MPGKTNGIITDEIVSGILKVLPAPGQPVYRRAWVAVENVAMVEQTQAESGQIRILKDGSALAAGIHGNDLIEEFVARWESARISWSAQAWLLAMHKEGIRDVTRIAAAMASAHATDNLKEYFKAFLPPAMTALLPKLLTDFAEGADDKTKERADDKKKKK